MNKIDIKCLASEGAVIPCYKTEGAAGADVCALIKEPVTIAPGSFAMIPTGLFFEIPIGYEIQVRPRSGLAAKNGVTVLNTPGTIDSDYRGELKIILINLGKEDYNIKVGDKIIYKEYSTTIVKLDNADYIIVEDKDVLATL